MGRVKVQGNPPGSKEVFVPVRLHGEGLDNRDVEHGGMGRGVLGSWAAPLLRRVLGRPCSPRMASHPPTRPQTAHSLRGLLCRSALTSWFCCFNNSHSLKLGIEKL